MNPKRTLKGTANPLVLLGFHEETVMNNMLPDAMEEYSRGDYDAIVLTGTSNPALEIYGEGRINDELGYMSAYLAEHHDDIPIAEKVPARTLMGNIRNVLSLDPPRATFFVDKSQVRRSEEVFIPYFQRRIKGMGEVTVVSPDVSYRSGSAYEGYASKMDRMYVAGLRIPGLSDLIEYACCSNNPFIDKLVEWKNLHVQKKTKNT